DIPAIMITLADGNKIKAAMKNAPVTIDFQTDVKIEKPELIDTLTDFTSKGPRSIDGAIKPEISAPGENIISAAMGQGKDIVQMSGTSMASPHVTGVAALLKQVHPDFTAAQIKALIMGGAKTIGENGKDYSVSLQGSGRIQADVSAKLKLLSDVPSLSLGEVGVETKKTLRRAMNIQNIGSDSVTVHVAFEGSAFVSMPAQDITVAPQASQNLAVNITLDASQMAADENIREMDGWIKFTQNSQEIYRIPVLAIAHRLSSIQSDSLVIESTSALDSDGAAAELTLENKNSNAGEAQLFNLIGQDDRKPVAPNFMTSDCDLQTAGYRIKKSTVEGQPDVLQIAVKLYKPMTTWNACDVSLMIDANGDGQYEQELLGSNLASIPGQTSTDFATTLLDASKARSLRKNFEVAIAAAQGDPKKLAALKTAEDYSDAIIDQRALKVYNNSSVVILEVAMDKLAATAQKTLAFKLIVTDNEQSASEFDDTLTDNNKTNFSISLKPEDQSYVDLPDSISLQGSATTKVELTKGQGPESLMLLMPTNRFSQSDVYSDSQLEILKPVYKAN
ncbi:MAG: S8 family serine peptidase, partial [Pseudobdellovibrio sp.]